MLRFITLRPYLLTLAALGAFASGRVALAKPVTEEDARASVAYAKLKCQELRFGTSECMEAVANAKYVDAGLLDLCLSRHFDKSECLRQGLDKTYTGSELEVCKKKPFDFLDCLKALGVVASIAPAEAPYDRVKIIWHLGRIRGLMEEGRHSESYRALLELETALRR